jgi:sigma-B regulation protein RsbU (phosphoserine phosphatase)
MSRRLKLILGSLFFLLMYLYAGVDTYQTLVVLSHQGDPGWGAVIQDGQLLVSQVESGGPADGVLRVGDEIVALNGEQIESALQARNLISQVKPHEFYTVKVRRAGQSYEFTLRAAPLSASFLTGLNAVTLIIMASFLVTGLVVFLLKPDDKQALLLALMFGLFPALLPTILAGLPAWLLALMVIARFMASLFFPIFFHFFLIFPEPSPLLRRFPHLGRYLYLPYLLLFLPVSVLPYMVPQRYLAGVINGRWLNWVMGGLLGAYIIGGLVSLAVNYQQASRLSRRKLRVVLAGSIAGFLPAFLLVGLSLFSELPRRNPVLLQWLVLLVFLAFTLFPLSFAYAIVRHQVIPVRLILRRSVRYVFVAQGSIVLEVIAVFWAVTFMLGGIFTYLRITNGWVIGIISAIIAVVVWNLTSYLHHRLIAPVIDRRFFRQAYDAQQILSELGQALRIVPDLRQETFAFVSTKIQEALQTENVAIFLREETSGEYVCVGFCQPAEGGSVALASTPDLRLKCDAFIIKRLHESPQPLTVDFEAPQSWTHALVSGNGQGHEAQRRETICSSRFAAALLLPIELKGQLLGFISLGPRLGDLPFSREDKNLLMAVAWQLAFAIENTRLVRRRAEEERLRHELEIATQVQRRLFPRHPPAVASLELAGVCHPARGVGGDYYDFLLLDRGQIGIAVADVSGKGISAAILMSTVQASLRSQAPLSNGQLTELVAIMNRLLCRSSDISSYATFFYAQFDEATRQLTYVNAGHNPPMLLRTGAARGLAGSEKEGTDADSRQMVVVGAGEGTSEAPIHLLMAGGPVIGMLEEVIYECETLSLQSGDLLVAFTDGLTEALNPAGEEFGEERLKQVVVDNAHLSAEELSRLIVERVRQWCQDVPQHDDLTLVVVKVK